MKSHCFPIACECAGIAPQGEVSAWVERMQGEPVENGGSKHEVAYEYLRRAGWAMLDCGHLHDIGGRTFLTAKRILDLTLDKYIMLATGHAVAVTEGGVWDAAGADHRLSRVVSVWIPPVDYRLVDPPRMPE
ncbi:MAG: hypothetical protein OXG44_15840 [Gammaproteobacteria bacterium]|nr:hypothetical protein [Gammaproteobacteria bacterium]